MAKVHHYLKGGSKIPEQATCDQKMLLIRPPGRFGLHPPYSDGVEEKSDSCPATPGLDTTDTRGLHSSIVFFDFCT